MRIVGWICCAVALFGSACNTRDEIWNGGDLEKWVRGRAVAQGFQVESIELEEWYVQEGGRNVWHGKGIDGRTGRERSFAIAVDEVWTPSSER